MIVTVVSISAFYSNTKMQLRAGYFGLQNLSNYKNKKWETFSCDDLCNEAFCLLSQYSS